MPQTIPAPVIKPETIPAPGFRRAADAGASPLLVIFSSVFFMAVSVALTAYFLSSYLKTIVDEKFVGLIFAVSYIISMVAINFFPYIITRLGALKSFLSLLAVTFLSLLVLAAGDSNQALLAVFVIFIAASSLLWITYDIIVEMFSKDLVTGRIRGMSLTLMNLGWVITPVVAGFLIQKYGFSLIFILAGLLLIIPFIVIGARVKEQPVKFKKHIPFLKIMTGVLRSPALRSVFVISFLLAFFYSWMVIYTPLYLLSLGFDWPTIGKIFSVMLIPFVIFQYPVGWLADKYFGETEMLSTAIVILAVSTAAIFYFSAPVAIAALLFCTRIGASIIESLRDSYFYKHISAGDVDLIDAFRNTGPFAYVVGPVIASGILFFLPFVYLYPILAAIMLFGLYFTFTMPDTK